MLRRALCRPDLFRLLPDLVCSLYAHPPPLLAPSSPRACLHCVEQKLDESHMWRLSFPKLPATMEMRSTRTVS